MVISDFPLPSAAVIERPPILANRGQADDTRQQATERQAKTDRKARHGVHPGSVLPRQAVGLIAKVRSDKAYWRLRGISNSLPDSDFEHGRLMPPFVLSIVSLDHVAHVVRGTVHELSLPEVAPRPECAG